jgi:hypothetical protein
VKPRSLPDVNQFCPPLALIRLVKATSYLAVWVLAAWFLGVEGRVSAGKIQAISVMC